MNYPSFIPTLFDARFHGVYSLKSVLDYHNSIEDCMPQDGIVWAVEHPCMDVLQKRSNDLKTRINELVTGMKGQPYGVWTVLDREAHILRCRLQLLSLAINEAHLVTA